MHKSDHLLFFSLIILLILAIYFALVETAMLSINRYRLRHLVKHNHATAKKVQQLLERPDRMLGLILLCGTFVNILASAVTTVLAINHFGEKSVMLATVALTFIILIFGEVAPKTLASLYPQRIAFKTVWPLLILMRLFYPLIWFINRCANALLSMLGFQVKKKSIDHLTHEELSTVLHEAGGQMSADYRTMLLQVLELKQATIEDIMVPKHEIVGIDLTEDWQTTLNTLTNSQHTRLPVYRNNIEEVIGILHLRKALNLLANSKLTLETLIDAVDKPYFVPEGTSLNVQLLNFRQEKNRTGLVVNEYGDIQGLITLEDILEEIVGEFTTDVAAIASRAIHPQKDGSFLVDGSITIRELNQALKTELSTKGPKTLSGLIIYYLEAIPQAGTALRLGDQPLEVMQVKDNMVKKVKILPRLTLSKSEI